MEFKNNLSSALISPSFFGPTVNLPISLPEVSIQMFMINVSPDCIGCKQVFLLVLGYDKTTSTCKPSVSLTDGVMKFNNSKGIRCETSVSLLVCYFFFFL